MQRIFKLNCYCNLFNDFIGMQGFAGSEGLPGTKGQKGDGGPPGPWGPKGRCIIVLDTERKD